MSPVDGDPIDQAAARSLQQLDVDGWHIGLDPTSFWTHYYPPNGTHVAAGVKIHVSASVRSAPAVLHRALPILVGAAVPFKHASSAHNLAALSGGHGGSTQVGKFMTVYPADDAVGQLVAELLHQATIGLEGPRIPHEAPFANGSLVYSRFGAFSAGWVQLRTGRVVPALRTDDGWIPDNRSSSSTGAGPDGRGGEAGEDLAVPQRYGRYVALRRLAESPRGSTWLAAEPDAGGLVVVKERLAHTSEDLSGGDAVARLRTEAANLERLAGLAIAPTVVELWEENQSAYLAYLPFEGPTAGALLVDLAAQGLRPPATLLRSWAESIAEILDRVHQAGLVVADVKPRNLVVMPDGFRLIDLELAGPASDEGTGGAGTPGYCSPQQNDPSRGRAVSDDVFAFGATLLALATSQEASVLPPLRRVAAIEHERDPDNPVYPLITACVDPDEATRPATIADALAHLRVANPASSRRPAPDHRDLAVEIGDRLASSAQRPDPRHACWPSDHPTARGQLCRDLYIGSAGVALFLAELGEVTGEERFVACAVRCGDWLRESKHQIPRLAAMPGLYFGDCGPAALFLRLGRLTGDASWFESAREVTRAIEPADVVSSDLMTGVAGVGLFQLMRWYSTGDPDAISAAEGCAMELGRRCTADRPIWPFPDDFDLLAGREYVGLSHGTAGIGYFLAELAVATGSYRWAHQCRETADWVLAQGREGLSDRSGLRWGALDDDVSYGLNWCHGSPGVLRFLLAAHKAVGDDTFLDAARRAGRMVAWGGSWVGTTQCHGLAGNLEALLDLEQEVGDGENLAHAHRLADNLIAYKTPHGWLSDRTTWCPDLMVGEAGVGAALLRLSCSQRSHLLAPSAFVPGG